MKNKIKGLLALALAAFTSGLWAGVTSSFGVNFRTAEAQDVPADTAAGFAKGDYMQPTTWANLNGGNGKQDITVGGATLNVTWYSRGTWDSGADTSTLDGKLLYNFLDDTVNSGRTKAAVKITGLPADKKYAVALILSGDADNDGFNGKYSPVWMNGQIYSYNAEATLLKGEDAVAATTWGSRRKPSAGGPSTFTEGTNVMFVEGVSGSELIITSAMDSQNVSRLTIAGVQVWVTDTTVTAPAVTAPTDSDVISVNFHTDDGAAADGDGLVAAKNWHNTTGATGTIDSLTVVNGDDTFASSGTLTYKSKECWGYSTGVTDNFLKGYLDDGAHDNVVGATITATVPFEKYSVIVYMSTDTAGQFKPVIINGTLYAGSDTLSSVGYADAKPSMMQNTSVCNWGTSQTATAVYGTNALRVDGLSGNLSIQAGNDQTYNGIRNRGGIAAIQIVNTGDSIFSKIQKIDWTAQPTDQMKVSQLPEITKEEVKLILPAGATLIVDELVTDFVLNLVSTGAVNIKVTDLTISQAQLDAMLNTASVAGGATDDYTETLGYTKDDVTYPLIFRGTTDANWATLSNWYIGARTNGETTYWIPYTGTTTPGAENSNEWRATLVDGELMAVEAGEDDYKTITIPASPRYEGWAPKITACNGVHVVIEKMKKLQSDGASGPSYIRVDDTSKITVTTFDAESQCNGTHYFYVNAKDGVNFSCPNQSGKLFKPSVSYYFDDDGSVNLGYVSGRQTVKEVKLDLGDSNLQGKTIVSRKLIGFSGTANCSFEQNGVSSTSGVEVAPLAEGSALEDADVGTYQFSVEDDGYYVNYVAYAPVAKIGDVEYATLGAAVAAAANGATITVLNDCTADTAIVIADKALTIDLNGKTVKSTGNDGNGVFWVKNDGVLTLEDSSEAKTGTVDGNGTSEYKMAIWADGGSVVINGGNYINVNNGPDDQYDLIYVKHGGSIQINGGTFICQTPRWTLNSHNTEKGTFEVKGGTFKDFNPTEVDTDDNVTTWCAEGYTAAQGQDGYWTVALIPVSNNVAKIGETEYETLEEAFEAAKEMTDSVTIMLLKDIGSEDDNKVVALPANKEIDFNLNDKTIYGRIKIEDDGIANVTIRGGKILNTTGSNAIWIYGGNINLVNLYLRTNYHGLRLENTASAIVNGGDYAITRNGAYSLLYAKGSSTLEVRNGSFIPLSEPGETYAVQGVAGTTVRIMGGTFTRTVRGLSEFVVSGGRFTETTYVKDSLAVGCMLAQKDSDGYYPVVKVNYALTVNAENATVSALNATYQYEDVISFTVTPAAGYKVTSVKLGTEELTAVDGNYTFKMPAEAVTITVTTEAASIFDVMINGQPVADADALKLAANSTTTMTVPEGTWSGEGNVLKKGDDEYVEFADYYTVVVNGTTVMLKLNKPVIGDSAEGADDAFTVTADAVTIKITNYNKDLNYGVRIAGDINGLKTAEITEVETEDGVITLTKSGDSAFFEVVVSDVDFPATPAE